MNFINWTHSLNVNLVLRFFLSLVTAAALIDSNDPWDRGCLNVTFI